MALPPKDRDVLRALVEQVAEIAALPVQAEKAELWGKLNRLEPTRPLVWINEVCWNEMNVDDELSPQCVDPWARGQERGHNIQVPPGSFREPARDAAPFLKRKKISPETGKAALLSGDV